MADTERMANSEVTIPDTPNSQKEPGPGLWLSVSLLTIGFAAACLGSYLAFQSAFELLSIDSFETPGEQTRTLDPGEYEIYLRSASVSILDLDIEFDDFLNDVGQITVTNAETGEPVGTESFRSSEQLSRSANIYEVVAIFEVESKGRFTVNVDSEAPSRAVFGRSIESSLDRVAPWLIVAVVGLALFILGTVLLIVGMVRRKNHRDRQPSLPPTQPVDAFVPAPQSQAQSQSQPQPPAPRGSETETPW